MNRLSPFLRSLTQGCDQSVCFPCPLWFKYQKVFAARSYPCCRVCFVSSSSFYLYFPSLHLLWFTVHPYQSPSSSPARCFQHDASSLCFWWQWKIMWPLVLWHLLFLFSSSEECCCAKFGWTLTSAGEVISVAEWGTDLDACRRSRKLVHVLVTAELVFKPCTQEKKLPAVRFG